jgi:hypothetical protein
VLEHAVVRVADDHLARVPVGRAQISDSAGVVEGLAGDRFDLVGKRYLPVAMIVPVHANRHGACSGHTDSMLQYGCADIRDITQR